MAVDPSVVINLAAEYTGKRAFKQADTATTSLMKNVKKLAKAIGLAYGTSAVIAYGKASVKAFSDDEASALRLTRAVENLGIGFANPAITDYIKNLEKSSAIADDILRPSFQSLLTTTGSLTKSQELLANAITISRASGIDLATVTDDLGKGYVGITKGLTKYNTGLTKAELTSKSFAEILGVMLTKSAGAAEDYLGSTSYTIAQLSIATGNASEIIGGGLVDAFARIAGGTEASDAATAIEAIATAIANVERAIGVTLGAIPNLLKNLKNLPSQIFSGFAGKVAGVNIPVVTKKAENKLTLSQIQQQELLAKLEAAANKRAKELLALKNKQVQSDKLKNAVAKANLALNKGTDVFNLDAIQINAAMINQTEQLGKVTSQAQLLALTNDIARLRIKQDILDLEAAIASGDVKAIEAATAKLNKDLLILSALQNQKLTLVQIESILAGLLPKDLINLANLTEALRLLGLIAGGGGGGGVSDAGIPIGDFVQPIPTSGVSMPAILEFAAAATERANAMAALIERQNQVDAASLANSSLNKFAVTINTGIGDPNAIAEAVNQVIQDAVDRGTLRGGAY